MRLRAACKISVLNKINYGFASKQAKKGFLLLRKKGTRIFVVSNVVKPLKSKMCFLFKRFDLWHLIQIATGSAYHYRINNILSMQK